jgi:hypothetical protein
MHAQFVYTNYELARRKYILFTCENCYFKAFNPIFIYYIKLKLNLISDC